MEIAAQSVDLSKYYCRRCDYPLEGLEDCRCPECGLAFNPKDSNTLSLRPTRRRNRRTWKLAILFTLAGLIVAYAVLFVTVPCGFSYNSYCSDCGEVRDVAEEHLPLLGFTFHIARTQRPSLLRSCLARHGIRQGHTHHWLFGAGGEYGLRRSCAIGEGRHLVNVVNSPEVAAFVDGLCNYSDPATRDRWINLLLDPFAGQYIAGAIKVAAPPPTGFRDAASFTRWWTANAPQIESEMPEFSAK